MEKLHQMPKIYNLVLPSGGPKTLTVLRDIFCLRSDDSKDIFVSACRENNFKLVKLLISSLRQDSLSNNVISSGFLEAATCGNFKIVKLLTKHQAKNLNNALVTSSAYGYPKIVNHLLKKETNEYDLAFEEAYYANHFCIAVKLLKLGASGIITEYETTVFRSAALNKKKQIQINLCKFVIKQNLLLKDLKREFQQYVNY